MPTVEETRRGSYAEPFVQEQYGVFTTKKNGDISFVAAGVSADDALTKATLYYHDMWEHDHNKKTMDMSEIERFFVRRRTLTFSTWDEEVVPAKEAVSKNNPWYERHWNE